MTVRLLCLFVLLGSLSINLCGQKRDSAYTIKHPGVDFRVQIAAFGKSYPDSTLFPDITSLSTYILPNGLKKYMSGSFDTYEEAVLHRKELIQKGYFGTFVVCFKNDYIIPISSLNITVSPELILLINEIKVTTEVNLKKAIANNKKTFRTENKDYEKRLNDLDPKNIHYRVQIGRFPKKVPLEEMEKFNQLKQLIFIFKAANNDLIYTVGEFQTLEKAQELFNELESFEFKNLEVIVLHNDTVIPKKMVPDTIK